MKSFRVFSYWLVLLLIVEVLLRFLFPLPEIVNFNRSNYQEKALDPGNAQFIRNQDVFWSSYPDTIHQFIHHLNAYGFRDGPWQIEKKTGVKRVLFIGDSFTEGVMANQDETIPATYQKLAGNEVEVMNMGMLGVGWNHYIRLLSDAVPLFLPDEVFILFYANDMPKGEIQELHTPLIPEKLKVWMPHLLQIQREKTNSRSFPLRGMRNTSSFLKAVPSKANPWSFNQEKLKPHVANHVAKEMIAGTFNYYRMNWILKEKKWLKQNVDIHPSLVTLKTFLSNYGVKLNIVFIPSRAQVTNHYYSFEKEMCQVNCPDYVDLTTPEFQLHQNILKNACSQLNVPFYDLTTMVKSYEKQDIHMYWNYDDHFKGVSYQRVAQKLHDWNRVP
jgi:hypothetical protein